MNINSGNIGELAGNQSILDKKERIPLKTKMEMHIRVD